jgi:hypothetical protein
LSESVVVHSDLPGSEEAGAALGSEICRSFQGAAPDVVILFASPKYEYERLLQAINAQCQPKVLVGCSSAGEFTGPSPREGSVCAVALRSTEMAFAAGLGRNLRGDRIASAEQLVASLQGRNSREYAYRSAMVLTDALAGHADELVEQITLLTAGAYQLFGGGAGDDAKFNRTHVFCGTEAVQDAAVVLEILSNKPMGIGMCHGWVAASPPMRVTESEGMRLISLNAIPAVEVFEEHARGTGQQFNRDEPLSFFLHNVLGIVSGDGYKLRVPLQVNADGSISCAADIPAGCTLCLMQTTDPSAAQAASEATESALRMLGKHAPKVAIFFDCVATRLRTGREFGVELGALQKALGTAHFVGCNTYGQITRAEGQFGGFHNCTAVIGVFPE